MDRWVGKVAVVTGASSGIGAATVKQLIKAGMVVVGLARRVERVEALKDDLPGDERKRLHAMKCDVSKEEDIVGTFKLIEEQLGGVDVLVNNAGVGLGVANLIDAGNTETLRTVIDTNVLGLVLCSREAVQSMKRRSVDGHIIHINSVAGHRVPPIPRFNIYAASKFAVTAITETMRQELRNEGSKTKVTSISPGAVKTDLLSQDLIDSGVPTLEPEDIADGIVYVLGTPPRVQVHELTIKPVGEAF
ncbi:farnesol dehydrogenase-like [Topomyia yanbarensis]|uniref:farnesol dehydrogenase-like n=1 Tax=Topomyia yanbarensis TaxID=2498891 RepID=UPI00273B1596|nr:farnesol dehydrogenase-like [Topomyia yanbarensis]